MPEKTAGQGKIEMNICEFPITALSERVPEGVKTLKFHDEIFDDATKLIVRRELTISGSDEYGLPRAMDDDVIVGLIQLTRAFNHFTDSKVEFTRFELIQLLGLKDQGAYYRRIEESLKRWVGVTLYYNSAWRDKGESKWQSGAFHIIESLHMGDDRHRGPRRVKGDGAIRRSHIVWGREIFKSFRDGYLKELDLDVYFHRIQRPVTRRIYRYLGKHFHRRARYTKDLHVFAFEKIGLSRNYNTGEIKHLLDRSFRELEEIGFLETATRPNRYVQVGRGEWRVVLVKAQPRAAVAAPSRMSVDGYWEALDDSAKKALEQKALEEADPAVIAAMDLWPVNGRAMIIARIREEYIAKLLDAKGS